MHSSPVASINLDHDYLLDPQFFTKYTLSTSRRPEPFGPPLTLLEFRGACVIAGSFLTRESEAQELLSQFRSVRSLLKAIMSSSGSFTLVVYDQDTRETYFLNDPLGGGFIFKYEGTGARAFSTSISSLRSVLEASGVAVTRDVMYELAGFATGTQHNAADTPFYEITVVDAGNGVRIMADGQCENLDYGVNNYIYGDAPIDISDAIAEGTSQIAENVRAVLDYDSDMIISDITGGFDSRLVLAAISALDACNSVTLRSLRGNAEWEFAEKLAATYDMRLTDNKAFGEVWGIHQDLYEDSVVGARNSGGIIFNEMGANSVPAALIKLQGGYGGTFRTFGSAVYSSSQRVPSSDFAKNSWKWAPMTQLKIDGETLFSDQFEDRLVSRATRTIDQGAAIGVSNMNMSSFAYAKGRLRYWFGQQSYHSSRNIAQFDPLYNTALIAASYRLDYASRRENVIGFEAMRALDQRLTEYPFYNADLPPAMLRMNYPSTKQSTFSNSEYSYSALGISPKLRLRSDLRREKIESQDSSLARTLGVKPEHVAGYRRWGSFAFDAVNNETELRSQFNMSALSELLTGPLQDGGRARSAIALLGAFFRAGVLSPDTQSHTDAFIFGR